nr:uncharacterized protein LOC111842969 isoform X2 [Paramormyrops kingsleyae]
MLKRIAIQKGLLELMTNFDWFGSANKMQGGSSFWRRNLLSCSSSTLKMNRQERLQNLAARFQQLVYQQTSSENPSSSVSLIDRLRMFRRGQELRRTVRVRQRLTTIRLAILPNSRDTIFIPRGSSVKKIVVPLSMPESAFIEKIREEFPSLQGDFCLCRVDRWRRIHQLDLSSICPSSIKACPVLRRSAVYIRPKDNGEEEFRNVHDRDMLEEQNSSEEEEEQNLFEEEEEDTLPEQAIEQAGLPEWHALRSQQDEEYQRSLSIDRERERRRRQVQERELRRVQVINTRKEKINRIPEAENGMTIQFKFPDGALKRRRFLSCQPFQDLVAFAGCDEMASEIFSLQMAMSPTSLLSTKEGSIADNGITAPCTLYILWMSGDEVELRIKCQLLHLLQSPPFPLLRLHQTVSPPSRLLRLLPSQSPLFTLLPLRDTVPYIFPPLPQASNPEEPFDIAARLKTLKSRVHHLTPPANQINVLRNEEFDCALRAFRRPAFDPESKLDIIFIDEDGQGEGAIYEGGPTREFCRLLMRQLQGHQIFEGPLEARNLALDSVALHNNTYRIVGQMLAVCLIQGGVSPHFFSQRLVNQLLSLPSAPATIEEVVDHGLRTKLEKISSAETLEDARQAVNEAADELALMGALRHLQSLDDSKQLMEAVLHFYCEGRIQAAIQQLREGLSTLGVLEEITLHPQAFEKIFLQDTSSLKASDLVGLFQARCRSLPGSNRRRLEARTIAFWKDWLLDIEGGLAHPITLEHVLIFATGLRRLPAMGFEVQPELAFLHAEDGLARFPKANTCSLVLYLPVGQTYNEFKNNMDLAVGCAHQFGEG